MLSLIFVVVMLVADVPVRLCADVITVNAIQYRYHHSRGDDCIYGCYDCYCYDYLYVLLQCLMKINLLLSESSCRVECEQTDLGF